MRLALLLVLAGCSGSGSGSASGSGSGSGSGSASGSAAAPAFAPPVSLPQVATRYRVTAKRWLVVDDKNKVREGVVGTDPLDRGTERPAEPDELSAKTGEPLPEGLVRTSDDEADLVVFADRWSEWSTVLDRTDVAATPRIAIGVAGPDGVGRAHYVLTSKIRIAPPTVRLRIDSVHIAVRDAEGNVTRRIPWAELPAQLASILGDGTSLAPVEVIFDWDTRIEHVTQLLELFDGAGVRSLVFGKWGWRYRSRYTKMDLETEWVLRGTTPEQGKRLARRMVIRRVEQLEECYVERAGTRTDFNASIKLELAIPETGHTASSVTITKGDAALAACFARVVAAVDFFRLDPPAPVALEVTLNVRPGAGLREP